MDDEKLIEAMARAAFERRHKGARNCYAWDDFWEENEYQRTHYMNEAQAALAAIEAAGFMVVPVEPTEAMVHQGGSAFDHPSLYMGGPSHTGKRKADAIYRAMIAAAPNAGRG